MQPPVTSSQIRVLSLGGFWLLSLWLGDGCCPPSQDILFQKKEELKQQAIPAKLLSFYLHLLGQNQVIWTTLSVRETRNLDNSLEKRKAKRRVGVGDEPLSYRVCHTRYELPWANQHIFKTERAKNHRSTHINKSTFSLRN